MIVAQDVCDLWVFFFGMLLAYPLTVSILIGLNMLGSIETKTKKMTGIGIEL